MIRRLAARIAIVSSAALIRVASAAEPATNEIVVTATRAPVARADVPASVTVISGEAIRNSPARNADDLLRSVPGVSVLRSYGMGHGIPSELNVRGVPGTHRTLLLADGIPLNEASSGFLAINEVPAGVIRQMEVVRGPFSALYGTDAFAGVVNLLTFDPADGPLFETAAGAGNGGYRSGSVRTIGGQAGHGYAAALDARSIDNYLGRRYVIESVASPSGQMTPVRHDAENYNYRDVRALGKVTQSVGAESMLTIQGRYFESELGYGQTDRRPLYPTLVDNDSDNRTALVGASLESAPTADLHTRFGGFYREQKREQFGLNVSGLYQGYPLFAPTRSENDGNDWQVEGHADYRLNADHTLSGGAEFHRVTCDFSELWDTRTGAALPGSTGHDASMDNGGAYLQEQADLTRALRLTAGARLDANSEFEDAVSPRVGARLLATDRTTIRASAGRAYRAPSLLELEQPPISFGSAVFVSNPNLDPEYITAADADVEQRLTDALTAHAGGFYNDMQDLIAQRVQGDRVTFVNIDDASSYGAEAGADWKAMDSLTLFAAYTWLQTEDDTTGRDLPYAAEHAGSAGARLSHRAGPWLGECSASEAYVGTRGYFDYQTGLWQDLEAYWRTDGSIRATYRDTVWLAFGVQNAANTRYRESSTLNPAPARLWSLEAGIRWW